QGLKMPSWSCAPEDAWTDATTIVAHTELEQLRQEERQGHHAVQEGSRTEYCPTAVAELGGMPLLVGDEPPLLENAQLLDNIGISADAFWDIVDPIGGLEYDALAEL